MENEEVGSGSEGPPGLDRRRGPRRSYEHIDPETGERRNHDRRKTPGLDALLDRMLGVRDTIPEPPPNDAGPETEPKP
jgi:hypothetical protein